MKKHICALLFSVLAISSGFASQCEIISFKDTRIPFDMPDIHLPAIPSNDYDITDFGAVGDGITDNTECFAAAIQTAASKGGGRIVVPFGVWLTGPIIFQSHIELNVAKGGIVLFSQDKSKYPLIQTIYEGYEHTRHMSPLYAANVTDIAITGGGIFDGNGEVWRHLKKEELTEYEWKNKTVQGGVFNANGNMWYPSESFKKGFETGSPGVFPPFPPEEISDFLRPVLAKIIHCERILIDGPTFYNSPAWSLHPVLSDHLVIRNATIMNHDWATNGDALDVESCRYVLIESNILSAGDDAICIKSGRNENGRQRGRPTEKVIVRHNTVFQGHGGVVIGSEMSGGVCDVFVDNCQFSGTETGIRLKTTRGRGGIVENIFIHNIAMTDITREAITISMYYQNKSSDEEIKNGIRPEGVRKPVNDGTPIFRNIFMSNIHCGNSLTSISMQGLPESRLENVVIENSSFTACHSLWTCSNAQNITMRNIIFSLKSEPPRFNFFEASNIVGEQIEVTGNKTLGIDVAGSRSADIKLAGKWIVGDINYSEGAKQGSVLTLQTDNH